MNEQPTEAHKKSRLRWVTLGEAVAIAALIVSAGGLWLTWKTSDTPQGPTEVVEKRQAVPLALRGRTTDEGRTLEISAVRQRLGADRAAVRDRGRQTSGSPP